MCPILMYPVLICVHHFYVSCTYKYVSYSFAAYYTFLCPLRFCVLYQFTHYNLPNNIISSTSIGKSSIKQDYFNLLKIRKQFVPSYFKVMMLAEILEKILFINLHYILIQIILITVFRMLDSSKYHLKKKHNKDRWNSLAI